MVTAKADHPLVSVVPVHTGMPDDVLVDLMREMRDMRMTGVVDHVVATIDGYAADPRELVDIPEARAFAARLVAIGFAGLLDPQTCAFGPPAHPILAGALGGAEVYLLSRDQLRTGLTPDVEDVALSLNRSGEEATRRLGLEG